MRVSVFMALAAVCTLLGCKADGEAGGPAAGSTGSGGAGASCNSASSSDDCCTVDADCTRTCAAGAFCRCAIRHEQPGHCYTDCPLERTQVTAGADCGAYSALRGCAYGPDGKLDPDKFECGFFCSNEGRVWVYIDCDFAAPCARTGGTPSSALCCYYATDFPPTCPEQDICACDREASTAQVKTCQCPAGMCFDRTKGCRSPSADHSPG